MLLELLRSILMSTSMYCFSVLWKNKENTNKFWLKNILDLQLRMLNPPLTDFVKHYHSLGWFSRGQIDNILSYFSQKTGFDISCKLSPLETYAWNIKTCFLGKKKRKIIQVVICWKYYIACYMIISHIPISLIFSFTVMDYDFVNENKFEF